MDGGTAARLASDDVTYFSNTKTVVLVSLSLCMSACAGSDRQTPANPPPPASIERSLFWTQPALVDDAAASGLARTMAAFSADGHGGALLEDWFESFGTTAHSARFGPGLLLDDVRVAQGSDATQWDLDAFPFTVTAIHNRIDLARDGHCGELRISYSSTHPTVQPLHAIFLFRQPGPDCEALAARWATLATLDEAAFVAEAKALLDLTLVPANALLAETVEQTVSPWEWRQWTFDGGVPANPPLFQTVDASRVNQAGTTRDGFLAWVDANAAAIDARTIDVPATYRAQSARVAEGVTQTPVDLTGSTAAAGGAYPDLRKKLAIVGCPACHTADADFVQTESNRTASPFYEKELEARREHLDALARGETRPVPFGPLQPAPILPD